MRTLLTLILGMTAACATEGVASAECEVEIPHVPVPIRGTLYTPDGARSPLVVIVPGSGPVDRDGLARGTGGVPSYRLLAESLTKRSFAVFTYDKRWLTKPNLAGTFTEEDHLNDLQGIITHFSAQPEIDPERMFLLGHSEGGALAAVLAARSRQIAGIVVIDSAAFPIDELLLEQTKGNPKLNGEIRSILRAMRAGTFPEGGVMLGASKEYWMEWIRFTSDTADTVSRITCPLMVAQGLKDETLPGKTLARNIDAWSAIAKGNARVTFKTYPNLTHMMFESGHTNVSEQLVGDVCQWMAHQNIAAGAAKSDADNQKGMASQLPDTARKLGNRKP